MTTQRTHLETANDGKATASADAGTPPYGLAISPAIGPVPAIYDPQSPGEPSTTSLVWHATVSVASRLDWSPSAASRPCAPGQVPGHQRRVPAQRLRGVLREEEQPPTYQLTCDTAKITGGPATTRAPAWSAS
jgi:hypothetical protein